METAVQETTAKIWAYQDDKVVLVPYVDSKDSPLPEDILIYLYRRLEANRFLELVFTGTPGMTLNSFISYIKNASPIIALHRVNNEVMGFGWINAIEGIPGVRKGAFGFCFFRRYWGREEIVNASVFALRWWFKELKIQILYGNTLAKNKAIDRFAFRMGFVFLATLPMFLFNGKKLEDSNLYYMTREMFDSKFGVSG